MFNPHHIAFTPNYYPFHINLFLPHRLSVYHKILLHLTRFFPLFSVFCTSICPSVLLYPIWPPASIIPSSYPFHIALFLPNHISQSLTFYFTSNTKSKLLILLSFLFFLTICHVICVRLSVGMYALLPTHHPMIYPSIHPFIRRLSIFLSFYPPAPPRQDAYRFKCTLNDFKLYTLYISLSEEDILNLHLP